MAKIKAGRRVGSKVRLTASSKRVYPQFANKVGQIREKEILTVGDGLAYGQRARYNINYRVRWAGQKRDYWLGASDLTAA